MPADQDTDADGGAAADTPGRCPKCRGAMSAEAVAGVRISRCENCQGIWLGALDCERLLAAADAEARGADTGGVELGEWTDAIDDPIACPMDHSRMIRMVDLKQPHVRFERCTVCGGMFLDAGELRDLASFTLIERLRLALRRARF